MPLSAFALSAPPRWTRLAGAVALLLALLFLGVALALQVLRADLQWQQATLSQYLHGPGGLVLRTVYVLLAAAVMALAAGLYAQSPPRARSGAPVLLFGGAALGLCGVAIGDSYLPQRAPLLAPLVHGLSAQTAFLCATSAMLLQSAWLRGQAAWKGRAGPLLLLAVLAFAALWVHVLWRAPPRGLTQKLAIVLILAWLLPVAYRLWRPAPAAAAQSRDNGAVFPLQDSAS
ncbi:MULTISPECIES: DUF998 domain-containing protein [Xanthomonas]|uniref:DUF998 domain-containing protein n=1 Tax=Xanthomonas TaxID=338 RepID=UPI001ADC334B|nr:MULTISPECIES: DUF998 domain-containing protein [unclassified Xanthomonas]MBO9874669.1 DUF998 domain-containing protein [Xanthomonas sp. D-93]WNH43740.1 DUF998 domain-containing protein [Xanthomonas sp. A6251]